MTFRRFRKAAALLFGAAAYLVMASSAEFVQAQTGITHNVETVLDDVNFLTSMAFAPDGRLFYTEKETGRVRVINTAGQLQASPVIELVTDGMGERGLIGIAMDPDYEHNHFIWVHHTVPVFQEGVMVIQRIVRFREEGGQGYDPQVMLEVPVLNDDGVHYGGNLHFDSEGYLYFSLGDHYRAENTTNLEVYPGKIHRFKVEGDRLVVPDDNPWAGSSAYAIGLRNPFDFVFDPYSDAMFATENGQQCDDEINLIRAGGNYGWRVGYDDVAPCEDERIGEIEGVTYPLIHYTPTIAPVGIEVYSGDQMPYFQGMIFFCAWVDGKMRGLTLDETRTQVIYSEEMDLRNTRCETDILTGPDGALYYASSTAIYRMVSVVQGG